MTPAPAAPPHLTTHPDFYLLHGFAPRPDISAHELALVMAHVARPADAGTVMPDTVYVHRDLMDATVWQAIHRHFARAEAPAA